MSISAITICYISLSLMFGVRQALRAVRNCILSLRKVAWALIGIWVSTIPCHVSILRCVLYDPSVPEDLLATDYLPELSICICFSLYLCWFFPLKSFWCPNTFMILEHLLVFYLSITNPCPCSLQQEIFYTFSVLCRELNNLSCLINL